MQCNPSPGRREACNSPSEGKMFRQSRQSRPEHPGCFRRKLGFLLMSHFFSIGSTLKLINIILFGLVLTKPVQSKPASLGPGTVRPSGETGLEQTLPQTGSVRTGGIIAEYFVRKILCCLY